MDSSQYGHRAATGDSGDEWSLALNNESAHRGQGSRVMFHGLVNPRGRRVVVSIET